MRHHEIEAWALQVIESVQAGQPDEDSRVELKGAWPTEFPKTARQIAGHCNAARGEYVLWLIGVDQKTGVMGADHRELANWFPKIDACFDGLAPRRVDLNIPVKGTTVVAILFETDRVPFVVKNPCHGQKDGGPVAWEVPWRENTLTRTATRADLIQVLSPLQKLPRFEVLTAMMRPAQSRGFSNVEWVFTATLYVMTSGKTQVVIPSHKCEASFGFVGIDHLHSFRPIKFNIPHDVSLNRATDGEAIIEGPGLLCLSTTSSAFPFQPSIENNAVIEITLIPVDPEKPIVIPITLAFDKTDAVWLVGQKKLRKIVSFAEMYENASKRQ